MVVLQTCFPPVLNRSHDYILFFLNRNQYYMPGSFQYSQEDFYFAFAKEKLSLFNIKITCLFGSRLAVLKTKVFT